MHWLARPRVVALDNQTSFSALIKLCKSDEASTVLDRIEDRQQLLLHPVAGKTTCGYTFTAPAFRQVCAELAGGSYAVLRSLLEEAPENDRKAAAAVLQIYNSMVRIAGNRLHGYSYVKDKSKGVIVGVVGRKYKFVSNYELLSNVATYFRGNRLRYKIVKGRFWNRDLFMLCLSNRDPVNCGPMHLLEGVSIYNSETTKNAIFIPRVLFDSETTSYSQEPETKQNRLIHRRKKNFGQSLQEVASYSFKAGSLVEELRETCLRRLSETVCPAEKNKLAAQYWTNELLKLQLNALPVSHAVSVFKRDELVTRWDFYKSLVRAATDFHSSERQLRTVAFQYLRGDLDE